MRQVVWLCIVVLVTGLLVGARLVNAEADIRTVAWSLEGAGARALARAIARIQGISESSLEHVDHCEAKVERPRMGTNPVAGKGQLLCSPGGLHSQPVLEVDFSGTEIEAFGNRFFPKAFAFQGSLAGTLYEALSQVLLIDPSQPGIRYSEASFPSPGFVYSFQDYTIYDSEGRAAAICSKEYFHPNGTPVPDTAGKVQCHFTYQWDVIPGDLF